MLLNKFIAHDFVSIHLLFGPNVLEIVAEFLEDAQLFLFAFVPSVCIFAHQMLLVLSPHYCEDFLLVLTLFETVHHFLVDFEDFVFDAAMVLLVNLFSNHLADVFKIGGKDYIFPIFPPNAKSFELCFDSINENSFFVKSDIVNSNNASL